MDDLLAIVHKMVVDVPESKITALADKYYSYEGGSDTAVFGGFFGTPAANDLAEQLSNAWLASGCSAKEIAFMLRGSSYSYKAAKSEESTELVWTGPVTPLVSKRRTEQVLLEIIRGAEQEIFIVSFVAYEVPEVMKALIQALDRGVEIKILIESSNSHGGGISVDSIAKMKNALPDAKVFYWTSDSKNSVNGGVVHAKCAVADSSSAFITSANLTSAALERNMELGMKIEGNDKPEALHRHLNALITTGVIQEFINHASV